MDADVTFEEFIPSKQERQSVVIPPINSRRVFNPTDTTYLVKLEDTTCHETSESSPIVPVASVNSAPLSTTEMQASPLYSQPNLPARLYFSPTLLHDEDDEEEAEEEEPVKPVKSVLSPWNQNRIGKGRERSA